MCNTFLLLNSGLKSQPAWRRRKAHFVRKVNDLLGSLVPLVSPSKRLTLNLFLKWDYKQGEIHQTSSIPFHWKRLKLALGKAVSASCSSNLATASAGEPSHRGEGGCVSCQAARCVFYFIFLIFFQKNHSLVCLDTEEGAGREAGWLGFKDQHVRKVVSFFTSVEGGHL